MSNDKNMTSSGLTPSAPPAAYAAFVRLYIEWSEKADEEQLACVKNGITSATLFYTRQKGSANAAFSNFKKGAALYGVEFDEYVNEVWAAFLEECSETERIAIYLQDDFEKNCKKFNDMKDEFRAQTFAEWDDALNVWGHLSDDEFNERLDRSFEKKTAEYLQKVAVYEKLNSESSKLQRIFRRFAQSMMTRLFNQSKKSSDMISIDDKEDDTGLSKIDVADVGNIEDEVTQADAIKQLRDTLDETNKTIFDLRMEGYTMREIGAKIGMSGPAVSKRLKTIAEVMKPLRG